MSTRESEVELLPGLPPRIGTRDDRAIVNAFDALAKAKPVRRGGVLELRLDLAWAAGVVRSDRAQVRERSACRVLDELAGANGSEVASGLRADPPLHGGGRESVTQKLAALTARRFVSGHEQHRAPPRSAQSRIDAGLADERVVEPEVLVVAAGDRVVHDAVSRARASVHADEERGIAASLQELRVLRPLVLGDELAVGIEILGDEGVERPPL